MLFKSILFSFTLAEAFALIGELSFLQQRESGCQAQGFCEIPYSTSLLPILFSVTSDAGIKQFPVGLRESCKSIQSEAEERKVQYQYLDLVQTSFEAPIDVPAFHCSGGADNKPDVFLSLVAPAKLARFLIRWDSRSWSLV